MTAAHLDQADPSSAGDAIDHAQPTAPAARRDPAERERRQRRRERRLAAADPAERRVGFIIAGVQKAGTSSLYEMLAGHPQIAAARRKELHFFDDETVDWDAPDYSAYNRLVPVQPSTLIGGESTPSYVFWPRAMERIRAYDPGMRIVLSFRDPIARAFSHWCMNKDRDPTMPDFGATLRARDARRWPATPRQVGSRKHAYVARGYYGQQLERTLSLFPAEQVLILDYHRAFGTLPATLDRITDFLGVDRLPAAEVSYRRSRPAALADAVPTPSDVQLLADRYGADLQVFGRLSGIDVSEWPTARVAARTLDPETYATQLAGTVRPT